MSIALTFPGQGSQQVGMGRLLAENFPASRAVFAEIDEALGSPLSTLIWEGPEDQLTLTENAQPALMAVSMAALRAMETEAGFEIGTEVAFVAGHSLGEYSALTAAGSFTLADAARLLRLRGQAMQRAVPVGVGAMAALLGLDIGAVKDVVAAVGGTDVQIANDNGSGQVVVSGTRAAVEAAVETAKAKGAKRAILLPVSAPFHCRLMQPAADEMRSALEQVSIADPVVPLIANVTASPLRSAQDIRQRLAEQVTGTVRWRESVAYMAAEGVDAFYEIGAGKVLTGLSKRLVPEAVTQTMSTPEEIRTFAAARR
ncbi:[acyl-carrier-protein] S-malonyltransferase [Rhodoligotrophos appendicifer]|uniref:ACP S-malonyltransferase n=1 Tax=Rhodoligotrophos appendicifer TaxID=987056 RepID=UPI0011852FC5|nr:ACP S-malonyltransferase [Rhodoligotrophos appendicifer]